jgi:hypothetical protein
VAVLCGEKVDLPCDVILVDVIEPEEEREMENKA